MIGVVLWLVAATVIAAGYTVRHGFSYRRAFGVVLHKVESGTGYARPLGGFVLPGFLLLGLLLLPLKPFGWLYARHQKVTRLINEGNAGRDLGPGGQRAQAADKADRN